MSDSILGRERKPHAVARCESLIVDATLQVAGEYVSAAALAIASSTESYLISSGIAAGAGVAITWDKDIEGDSLTINNDGDTNIIVGGTAAEQYLIEASVTVVSGADKADARLFAYNGVDAVGIADFSMTANGTYNISLRFVLAGTSVFNVVLNTPDVNVLAGNSNISARRIA